MMQALCQACSGAIRNHSCGPARIVSLMLQGPWADPIPSCPSGYSFGFSKDNLITFPMPFKGLWVSLPATVCSIAEISLR